MIGSKPFNSFDAIVIGSGFAGAVTACRLAEAGLRVCILERGRRFDSDQDFPVYPKPNEPNVPSDAPEDGRDAVQPDLTRMFWKLGKGVWDFRDLGDVLVGQAAGYGGGSLIYANVQLRPPAATFDERWRVDGLSDDKQPYQHRGELDPYFDLAARMLDVELLPKRYADLPKRVQLKRAAQDLNRMQKDCRELEADVVEPYLRTVSTPLAVNFQQGRVGLDGQPRGVCDLKGNCCLGCKAGAKNTLDLNYLYRAETAERTPAEVRTLAEVTCIERNESRKQRFTVEYRDQGEGGVSKKVDASYVFLGAGAVNTTELLMRCHAARKLELTGHGLGTRFHPNQDALYAVFDCDEPQELDRGPTITSTLVYDRQVDNAGGTARWRLSFKEACFEPAFRSKLTLGTDSGFEAEIASPAYVVAGSFEEKDAIGEVTLTNLKGKLEKGQTLYADGREWGKVDFEPRELPHWFLIQDGGFPVDFEPWLGVFRSPLWLGRNGFREAQRLPNEKEWPRRRELGGPHAHDRFEHASASQRIGYATLPVEAIANLVSGLTRGDPRLGMAEATEVGAQRLYRLSEAHNGNGSEVGDDQRERKEEGAGAWKMLPSQFSDAADQLRERALDALGLGTESIVSSFLENAAKSLSGELGAALGSISRTSDSPYDVVFGARGKINARQLAQFNELGLARGALRLGTQLLWGSQSGLARAIGDQLWETTFAGRGKLAEAALDLVTRLLDYRLGNGRTAMLLSMGLDSAPGRLRLDLPVAPRLGSELLGQKSRSKAYVLDVKLDEGTSFGAGDAAGRLIVAGAAAPFKPDETLFSGNKKLGKFEAEELDIDWPSPVGRRDTSSPNSLRVRVLRFGPAASAESSKRVPPALHAQLRAESPEAIDTPERAVQERVLRDIASAWDGELRTDPLWTFFDRRITVHPQGGCPMGPEDRAVTKPSGEVYGCDGLYVMDAAAFPGPVGANPSATIAAVAEYKVAKFIEQCADKKPRHLGDEAHGQLGQAADRLKKEREEAVKWVDDDRRTYLDPLGSPSSKASSVAPAHQPVGIEFTERMEGVVETHGRRQPIETELTVRIDDLAEFLALHARGAEERIPIIEGTLAIGEERKPMHEQKRARDAVSPSDLKEGEPGPNCALEPIQSYMVVMARPGLDDNGKEVRTIQYHLVTRNGKRVLEGKKTIRDDPGFDAWEDTTRLKIDKLTEFNEQQDGVESKGELLLPAAAFFDLQLPSFRADTDDPARQMWAMATFGRFFFGHLASVYLPELARLGGLASNLVGRGHG